MFPRLFLVSAVFLVAVVARGEWPPELPALEPLTRLQDSASEPRDSRAQAVVALTFIPDGRLLSADGQGVVCEWEPVTGRLLRRTQTELPRGWERQIDSRDARAAISPDGKYLAITSAMGTRLCELASGREVCVLEQAQGNAAIFTPDGTAVAVMGLRGVSWWDVASGRKIRELDLGLVEDRVHPPAFALAADGQHVAASWENPPTDRGSRTAETAVWHLGTKKKLWNVRRSSIADWSLALSSDARLLAVEGRWSPLVRDGTSGAALRFLKKPDDFLATRLVFSPSERVVAAGLGDRFSRTGQVWVWEVASGGLRHRLGGLRGVPLFLAFSADSRLVASGGIDGVVLVWDLSGQHGAPGVRLTPAERRTLWADLDDADGEVVGRAMLRLGASPGQAVPFLRQMLPAVVADDLGEATLTRLLADLDADDLATREQAQGRLGLLGGAARPALEGALKRGPAAEVSRRVEHLLDRLDRPLPPPESLRGLRIIEVLEGMGTPAARAALHNLAGGLADSPLTRAASASLRRLHDREPRGQRP